MIAVVPFTAALWAQEKNTANLDEVIVTVNKMEENINDVVKQVPNLSEISYDYQRAINFRGINQSLSTSTNSVIIYADGVPQNSIFGYDVMLENAERVEILRSPQSTLYGKDSIGTEKLFNLESIVMRH